MLESPTELQTVIGSQPGLLTFHNLVYLVEGDEVTVGRPDQGAFVMLPADGAALLRKLEEGTTVSDATAWYEKTYGEPTDVAEFVEDLRELGFLVEDGESPAVLPAVRWQHLGNAIFSKLGLLVFGLLVGAAAACIARSPSLAPNAHNLFFTHYLSVMVVTLFVLQMPLILLHESAHALAGRRLGLQSKLSLGRRLYFIVFQTSMDGLVAVPRKSRYLPILAGMLADVMVIAVFTLSASTLRNRPGASADVAGILLALAFLTFLRISWQFWLFLQTDIYYLVVTVLRCVDLQTTSKQLLRNKVDHCLRRQPTHDPGRWHPQDHRVARWYSLLIVVGYLICAATLFRSMAPAAGELLSIFINNLTGHSNHNSARVIDSVVFLALSTAELVVAVVLAIRERRTP